MVDEDSITDLNREHMGADGPTDVLAFPVDDPAEVPGDLPVLLGDVVICPAVAARQAKGVDGGLQGEMSLLLVHGILHLLGHDHAEHEEREVMQRREGELLAGFGF
jgi:Predicted metal-dependent hydrolase